MTYTNKEEYTKDLTNTIEQYSFFIGNLEEIEKALIDYKSETINITFFKKYFNETHDGRDYQKYHIRANDWEWSKDKFKISIGYYRGGRSSYAETVDVENRNRAHILERVQTKKAGYLQTLEAKKKELEKLASFDESALVADLLALYKKYDNETMWRKVLESYEVKYPKND